MLDGYKYNIKTFSINSHAMKHVYDLIFFLVRSDIRPSDWSNIFFDTCSNTVWRLFALLNIRNYFYLCSR